MTRLIAAGSIWRLIAAGSLVLPALAQQAATFQIRADEILLDDGSRIDDGVLLIEDGRIRKVGRGVEVDPALPLVEHEGVLTAGLVVCETQSATRGEANDPTRAVLSAARTADAFDADHPDLERALRSGITTMVLSPGASNVVGGRTAVVKSTGEIVSREGQLVLSFSKYALADARSWPSAVEETSLSQRGERFPTSYSGAQAELERLFEAGQGDFGAAKRGEVHVLIEAWERHEVARAAEFARANGLRGAIRGVTLAPDLVEPLRQSGLGVVLGPYWPSEASRVITSARALIDAGIPIAFALDGPTFDPEQVRLSAAMAVSAGAEPAAVWRALTGDAARLAGVDARVGLIERGRDADLVAWSGDPLNLTSRVRAVYVGGKLVFRGEEPR